jgi:predicted small secreted protein
MKTNRLSLLQRLLLSVLATAVLVIVGAGCNTAHGFGKDIENAGEGIQNGTK